MDNTLKVHAKHNLLVCQQIAHAIKIPLEYWPGNCYAVAMAMVVAGIHAGKARYGVYNGPIHPKSMFGDKPFARHGWIECDDCIVDPTRYVFENRQPYIAVVDIDNEIYDFGAQALRERTRIPYSNIDPKGAPVVIPEELRATLSACAGCEISIVSMQQLCWLSNSSLAQLGFNARPFYEYLQSLNKQAFVPVDLWEEVMG
jgi:hypothetical protein